MKTFEIVYRCELQSSTGRARPADAATALQRLDEGNRAFANIRESTALDADVSRLLIKIDPCDFGFLGGTQGQPAHNPFAAVLGCSDARVPIELVLNEGPNELFVIRVAGNVLGADVLGSLKYALAHLDKSIRIIAVMGHSGCGAVSSAVDVFLDPSKYLGLATSYSLRSILDRVLVIVQASAKRLAETFGPEVTNFPGYRTALLEASIVINAAMAAYTIRSELSDSVSEIDAVYGVFLIETGAIWAPRAGTVLCEGFAAPPTRESGFMALGDAVLHSDRITSLLNAPLDRQGH